MAPASLEEVYTSPVRKPSHTAAPLFLCLWAPTLYHPAALLPTSLELSQGRNSVIFLDPITQQNTFVD